MNNQKRNNICPVCGCELDFIPWDDDIPADEICPSCGIQFGYDDVPSASGNEGTREEIYTQWREKWILNGMRWYSQGRTPPDNWNPKAQLEKLEM
jgi:hypothetical protein